MRWLRLALDVSYSPTTQVEGAEGELQDLRRTLTQIRKKMAKQGSEMNDLQLHLESQQARNVELEKKQKR